LSPGAVKDFDALVIGAGPAGSAAAILLAQAGWSVSLAEKDSFPRDKVCGGFIGAGSLRVLDALGAGDAFRSLAGPPVRAVGFFGPGDPVIAPMPRGARPGPPYGGAVRREQLDAMLLELARDHGARIHQPAAVVALQREGGAFLCRLREGNSSYALRARHVVAAHGSWLRGPLPTQQRHAAPRDADLFGFKAYFSEAALAPGLMPLIAFPGGYGGLVQADAGIVSLSFCIRSDALARCRQARSGAAADAALAHIVRACPGARDALLRARRIGPWRSAGPIRPGIRAFSTDGVHMLGNAAGEAHPAIAEGITMALQSAAMLSGRLIEGNLSAQGYEREWRSRFGMRLGLSTIFAHVAMRSAAAAASGALLRRAPGALSALAALSGKADSMPPLNLVQSTIRLWNRDPMS
jgi:flavin-dependent dehydrogenase